MMPTRSNVAGVVVTTIINLGIAAQLHAQEPRRSIAVGAALSTQYPDRFQEGCGNPAGVTPSVRIDQRIHRIVSAEFGISGSIQMPPGVYCSADAVPLQDGDVVREFDATRGSFSMSGEARLVLVPWNNQDVAFRLIGGGAWYPTRRSPAWLVGAGFRRPGAWRRFVFDVEYWSVGVSYDVERFRVGAPREFLGDGREWQGFLQLRVGITVWSH